MSENQDHSRGPASSQCRTRQLVEQLLGPEAQTPREGLVTDGLQDHHVLRGHQGPHSLGLAWSQRAGCPITVSLGLETALPGSQSLRWDRWGPGHPKAGRVGGLDSSPFSQRQGPPGTPPSDPTRPSPPP